VCGLLLVTACNQVAVAPAQQATVRIAGSSSMRPLLDDLTAAYEAANPAVVVALSGGGSVLGLQALEAGSADVAAVSWQPASESTPPGLQFQPIARDGLAVIVHPTNRIAGLTILQLRALYRGELLDWTALGGSAEEPIIVSREDGSGDRTAFETMVMGGERVTLNARILPTAQAVTDFVAAHPTAVGYVSLAQESDDVRTVPIEGLLPTPQQITSGAYHLSRLLYLVLPEDAPLSSRSYVNFALSPVGQEIVADHHVPLRTGN
jgi:phosphate transport system substrate-binding protein